MKPVKINNDSVNIAENQEEYQTLPAIIENGVVTTCWELDEEDLQNINKSKRLYLQVITYGKLLQPLNLTTINPLNILNNEL